MLQAGGAFQELPLIWFLSSSSLLELREFRGLEGKEAENVFLEETGKAFVTLLVYIVYLCYLINIQNERCFRGDIKASFAGMWQSLLLLPWIKDKVEAAC